MKRLFVISVQTNLIETYLNHVESDIYQMVFINWLHLGNCDMFLNVKLKPKIFFRRITTVCSLYFYAVIGIFHYLLCSCTVAPSIKFWNTA